MSGIKETKEVVAFALCLGNSLGKALEDKKIGLSDLPLIMGPMAKLPAALAGLGEVSVELKDLTGEELEELYEFARTEFDIPNESVEDAIKEGLALVAQIHAFIMKHFVKA
jgi:hypothetical protein